MKIAANTAQVNFLKYVWVGANIPIADAGTALYAIKIYKKIFDLCQELDLFFRTDLVPC